MFAARLDLRISATCLCILSCFRVFFYFFFVQFYPVPRREGFQTAAVSLRFLVWDLLRREGAGSTSHGLEDFNATNPSEVSGWGGPRPSRAVPRHRASDWTPARADGWWTVRLIMPMACPVRGKRLRVKVQKSRFRRADSWAGCSLDPRHRGQQIKQSQSPCSSPPADPSQLWKQSSGWRKPSESILGDGSSERRLPLHCARWSRSRSHSKPPSWEAAASLHIQRLSPRSFPFHTSNYFKVSGI